MVGLDYTWGTKGSHGSVCFYQPGSGSGFFSSIKLLEYNQILKSYFREQVGVFHIFINKPTEIMLYCSGKKSVGQTEEYSFIGKTNMHSR